MEENKSSNYRDIQRRLAALEETNRRRHATLRRAALFGGAALALTCVLWAGGALAWTSILGLFTFNANSPAKASEINHNFETLEAEVLAKVNAAGDTMSGDLTVNGTVTADNLAMDTLTLGGVPMNFAKMRVWRGSDDTIHFEDAAGTEHTYILSLVTCSGPATVDNNPAPSKDYIRKFTIPTCVDIDPGIGVEWGLVETNQLWFNITGAASDDCTLLYDTGGGRFSLFVDHDHPWVFGPGNTSFVMQGITGAGETTFPITTNKSYYIVCF